MNVYELVNSKDIRGYLEEIHYEFNTIQVVWLIYADKKLKYEEKKAAWSEVMETMPDQPVEHVGAARSDSIFKEVRKYIQEQDELIAELEKEDTKQKYVYSYSYYYEGDHGWTEEFDRKFSSLSKCLEDYHKESEDDPKIVKYQIKRQTMDEPDGDMIFEYDRNGELIEVVYGRLPGWETEMIDFAFDDIWLDFPTPFKEGDIVWIPKEERDIRWDCDGGFVLRALKTWKPGDAAEWGDESDMCAYGYFVNPNGTIYQEATSGNYMDLEYYRGPYKKNERILPALSKYIKDEISLDFLMCVYRKTMLDILVEDVMLVRWYSEEMLEEVGITE